VEIGAFLAIFSPFPLIDASRISALEHKIRLATVDPELAKDMAGVGIPPQLYLLRWIRVLFARELPVSENQPLKKTSKFQRLFSAKPWPSDR
jgi:hypothetical protein